MNILCVLHACLIEVTPIISLHPPSVVRTKLGQGGSAKSVHLLSVCTTIPDVIWSFDFRLTAAVQMKHYWPEIQTGPGVIFGSTEEIRRIAMLQNTI